MNEPTTNNSLAATHKRRPLREALAMLRTASDKRCESRVIELASETISNGGRNEENDPLLCKLQLPLRAVFYPLGFAVEITTNSQAVLDAAGESWKHLSQRYSSPALRIGIAITGGGSGECPPRPVVRAHRQLLTIIANPENQAACDLGRGYGYAWLSRDVLLHPGFLRYHYIEAIALILISNSYATAIHAACVSRRSRGLLLCGDSGAGKSSLAYACARAGWTYTSDDACYLLRAAGPPRVVGNSRQIRFRPSAADLFPEICGRAETPRAAGKPSIEVQTAELPGLVTEDEAPIHYIVFLNRQTSAGVDLVPFSRAVAMRHFHESLFPEDENQPLRAAALQRLSTVDVYELRYRDLEQAVERLERLARGPSASLRAPAALASVVI
jgi:hypothetical protein